MIPVSPGILIMIQKSAKFKILQYFNLINPSENQESDIFDLSSLILKYMINKLYLNTYIFCLDTTQDVLELKE